MLDYGDPDTIDDVSKNVLRGGFRTLMGGVWRTATPQHPEMVLMLAHHYAHKGMLVFLDEPSYGGRSDTVEDRLPAVVEGTLGLVGHPGDFPACPRAVDQPVTLAIGPEGGWIPYEIDLLRASGLNPVQLGERILRVETAVTALLARLF